MNDTTEHCTQLRTWDGVEVECPICGLELTTETELYAHYQTTDDDDHRYKRNLVESAPSLRTLLEAFSNRGAQYVSVKLKSLIFEPMFIFYQLKSDHESLGTEIDSLFARRNASIIDVHSPKIITLRGQPAPAIFVQIESSAHRYPLDIPLYVSENKDDVGEVYPGHTLRLCEDLAAYDTVRAPEVD